MENENFDDENEIRCFNCGTTLNSEDEKSNCAQCEKENCIYCRTQCGLCGSYTCARCRDRCRSCGSRYCSDCIRGLDCGHDACENCTQSCGDHDVTFCADCSCGSCDENESDDDDCPDLIGASNYPRIFKYCACPDWSPIGSEKEGMFLGTELEMNFPGSKTPYILPIPSEYLRNRHIWKNDGSLSNGAELVSSPHTLAQWHKVKLNEMCDRLKAKGATSYQSGECGLHIHADRSWFGENRSWTRLKTFFSAHKEYLRCFAQRSEDQLNRWAKIPDPGDYWEHHKYSALHKTSYTIEFRLFRGTLFFRRLKASLQFVPAVMLFCHLHSLGHCKSKHALESFRSMVKKLGYKELIAEHDRAVCRSEGNESRC